MRTTIVLDDVLAGKVKSLVTGRKLSEFINRCVWEHINREEKKKRLRELEKAYNRASREAKNIAIVDAVETEDWPEW